MIWTKLGNEILQQRIGETTIKRLEPVLKALDGRGDVDLYKTENLSKIFDAFIGVDLLANNEFRTDLLNRLSQQKLNQIASSLGISTFQLEFNQILKQIIDRGWRNEEFIKTFLESIELGNSYIRIDKDEFKPITDFNPVASPYKPLKDYQFQVYCDAIEELANQNARFLIQMPTGSGKTRTAMEFVCEVLNSSDENSLVIWIAHSEELCSQAVECFSDVWSHVGRYPLKCFRCWGNKGALPDAEAGRGIVFASFQRLHSIFKGMPQDIKNITERVRLVVVDEAHKVMAPTYKTVTSALLSSRGKLVGLTATPGRSAVDSDENSNLANYFHNQILRLHQTGSLSIIELLRQKKILSKLSNQPLRSSRKFSLSNKDREYVSESFDLPSHILSEIADDDVRNVEIIKRLEIECIQGKKIIFFGCNIKHSKFICALLIYLGYKAAHVDGQTGSMRRKSIIQSFKHGDTQVICNFGILTTGFDAPKTDVVFIARPTASVVLYSQMIGRGLRGPLLGGTETCILIDVRDNIEGFVGQTELYEYFDEYWASV